MLGSDKRRNGNEFIISYELDEVKNSQYCYDDANIHEEINSMLSVMHN